MHERNVVLTGSRVRLEPLRRSHLDGVREAGNDPALWEFTYSPNPFSNDAESEAWFEAAQPGPHQLTFAIVDRAHERIVGSTRYADIASEHRRLEIGWTFLARDCWRTGMNLECKYLLLAHAFDAWNVLRVQLKANAHNERSRLAMAGLGATYEGTLRNFRIQPRDGASVGVSYYSIIRDEWPDLRARLQARLAR